MTTATKHPSHETLCRLAAVHAISMRESDDGFTYVRFLQGFAHDSETYHRAVFRLLAVNCGGEYRFRDSPEWRAERAAEQAEQFPG